MHVATYQRARDLRPDCDGDGCEHDEALLSGLAERIQASRARKILVVLHLRGSHGPAYHSEYPPRFAVFEPVCDTVDLSACSAESLVNAYDNTLLYTDHVLARTIDLIDALPGLPAALLYLSDHGESLGEYGLYLHGTPWSIAPDVQKSIPFIVWMSVAFSGVAQLRDAALDSGVRYNQANVFHSVMGALGLTSPIYDTARDIFADRAPRPASGT